MVRRLLYPLFAAALTAAPAAAQVVRGVVVEDDTSAPVSGAMVILLELDGTVARRVLSDDQGAFITRVDHPGAYLIRVDRIGYESITTDRFDVPVDGTFQHISVPIRPVELTGLDVRGARRCQLRPEQGQATARVWDEARKALEAAAWTLASGAYRYTLLHFTRTFEPDGFHLVNQRRHFVRGTGQAPYVSLPGQDLVKEGFIRRNPDHTLTYYAPDAEAFLSDAFLDTHCMRLKETKDGLVGLEFEPVKGRHDSDIRGTLWIEATTDMLRQLEFHYVNRPDGTDYGEAGGEVRFGRLPNGMWIVRDWYVRMPLLASDVSRSRWFLRGYEEQGGTVWRVIDVQGSTLVEAQAATVSGALVDSLGAKAVPDARVTATDGDGEVVTTGEDGSFLLPGLPPGVVSLEVRHPSLDTLGLGPMHFMVDAAGGQVSQVRLRLPGVGDLLRSACADAPPPKGPVATVLGLVTAHGAPATGALVRVRWLGNRGGVFDASTWAAPPVPEGGERILWTLEKENGVYLRTTLDSRGVFMVCGVPRNSQLHVEALSGEHADTVITTVTITPGDSVVVTSLDIREAGSR